MDDKIRYWTSLADYDLETARAMLQTERFLYVGFMCHQAVEKMLKSAWQAAHPDEVPPRIHNLERLAAEAGLLAGLSRPQRSLLTELEPLNVEARYPSHKAALLKKLTKRRCAALVARAEELTEWIGRRLSGRPGRS